MDLIRLLQLNSKYNRTQLNELADNSHTNYQTYYKAKKSGGTRLIAKPSKDLKMVQKILVKKVFSNYPVSNYTAAYEQGSSIVKNARRHLNGKYILRLDIKDFFPSIKYKHVMQLLKDDYSATDIIMIWKLISYNDGLPVGACTSPAVCNRVFYNIDKEIASKARKLTYTRYADDLVFSSRRRIDEIWVNEVDAILKNYGFNLNREKTLFMGKGARHKVTGIIIDNKQLTVGLAFRKRLKSDIYKYITQGVGETAEINGRVAFLASVEPQYVKMLKQKYSQYFAEILKQKLREKHRLREKKKNDAN